MRENAGGGMCIDPLAQRFSEWRNQLECLTAHLSIIHGNRTITELAVSVQKQLLNPVKALEQALSAKGDGTLRNVNEGTVE